MHGTGVIGNSYRVLESHFGTDCQVLQATAKSYSSLYELVD